MDAGDTPRTLPDGARVVDSSGMGNDAVVRTAGGQNGIQAVSEGSRIGLEFPDPCRSRDCPKAILEVADSPDLVPGTADFDYGATVLLNARRTASGENIMQKGFSTGGGSQWKLQVDGLEGKPSCVLVERGGENLATAESATSIADGQWHDLRCRRTGSWLELAIDGVAVAKVKLSPGYSVTPEGEVRIGGKNIKNDNDQFFGVADDIFVSVVNETD